MRLALVSIVSAVVGAFVAALCLRFLPHSPTMPTPIGPRFSYVGFEKLETDDRVGLVTGMSDKVLDTQTGDIYQRIWGIHLNGGRTEERTVFVVTNPTSLSTNRDRTVRFTSVR